MHGTSAGAPVTLSGYGGLVTLAKPESVPEGASPRTYDGDYDVGGWKTRAGLTSAEAFGDSSVGPSGGGAAADAPLGGTTWTDPGNVLLDTAVYATATVPGTGTLNATTVETISYRVGVGPIRFWTLITFEQEVPALGTEYTFSGFTHATGLNGQTLASVGPGFFTPTAYQAIFDVFLGVLPPTADAGTATVPTDSTDGLNVTQFGFSVPPTSGPQGFGPLILCYASAAATLNLQMLKNGVPVGNIESRPMPVGSVGPVAFGSLTDLFGASWASSDLNSTEFGLQFTATSATSATIYLGYVTLECFVTISLANFQFIDTFTAQNGAVKNVALDASGNFYVEDVTNNPGVLTLAMEGITPGSYMLGVNGPDVEYLACSNLSTGSDMPMQYTANWIDRITQVGPGAPPIFTPQIAGTDSYAIDNISQTAQFSQGYCYFLQSTGPGSTAPGNIVTIYYSDSTVGGPDTTLVDAYNSGNTVYAYLSFTGSPTTFGPLTVQITSVGLASPPGQPRQFYYLTFVTTGSPAFTYYQGSGHSAYTATFQLTLATLVTSVPVPGLEVGNQITIAGNSESGYNNVWNISQALNSSEMEITETSVTSGVATYAYALTGGSTAAPAAGQLVTITGTTNANGALNLLNATIASATGGSSGSFTVDVSVPINYPVVAEDGQATTAGTEFCFDPGINTLGTSTNPIYGTGTGGTLTFAGASGQFIAPGTKQGVIFFITRNGYYTQPSPPVTFTVPENCTGILVSQIALGPPNVIKRGIALTESGQNGTPGGNFYTIPTPVTYIVNNQSYTASALTINDNTTTSATFFFTDFVLLGAEAIDVYGYNLFNQIEIGDPGWVASYADRNWYGQCLNKVQNFVNLSFDGGYLPATTLIPLGWTQPDAYGSLIVSPKFGNAYYIKNTSSGTLATAGLISQTAYQDAYQEPILNSNTAYSVQVTCSNPSGVTGGNLVISLTANGITYGSLTLPFASMASNLGIFSGTLLVNQFAGVVPPLLTLNVSATEVVAGADVLIDRVDIYPTAIPILATTVYGSYAGLPEQVDAVTGAVVFSSENQQPVNGAVVMYDTFYGLKGWGGTNPGSSLYSLQKSSDLEPAQWDEPEVAQRSGGAIGPLAFDLGEQWFLGASRAGLYLFVGGQPGKITQEIYQVWDAINWTHGNTIWVKVDTTHRKIYVGVPMATPNFWLPNAPVNANPTSPNVILMCNYQGLDSGEELKQYPQMHTTMFGTLNAIDMRRKWSIWQIPSPFANLVAGATDQEFLICNGEGNSKIYALDETNETDDGAFIDSLYTTAGLVELAKRAQTQGIGTFRLRWGYMVAALESLGNIACTLYPNRLLGPGTPPDGYNSWQLPGGFSPGSPALNDAETPLNFAATRTFIEFRENDGHGFSLSNLVLKARADVWNQLRGQK